jgi:gliding motility-associated-like protein
MKKIISLLLVLVYSSIAFTQILITDSDLDSLNPLDCIANSGPAANFFDSGNNSANYGSNENEVIVICPDYAGGTSKLALTYGINTGLLFGVDASDTIYVYDGPNVSSALLGKHNSSTDPTGFNHVASFLNNPSGCLTVQFISDGAVEGIGWDANVTCVTIPQPFEPHMAGYLMGSGPDIITPSDTGYSDICFGDSILFVATGNYPYSSDVTGVGYSQNSTNVSYEWEFSNGITITGPDSVWFKPPARSGYLVTLKITDQFPQAQSIMSKVRVSTIPSFAGVINNRDSICVGDTTVIIGAVTNTDTAGVDPTSSNFQMGGTFAGLTWLPDGSGLNYTTSVNINGFQPAQTITSISDIQQLNITMEHSYLGDLEMLLECPNGTQATIFNSYSPGIIPGGFSGGSTFLGDAYDNNLGTPGIGWEYKWSSVNATWGNFPTEFAGGNTLPTSSFPVTGNAMNPNGIYLPETSFASFIGCPINGNWTITVRDNLGVDDGYIFEWGIFFDPSINPNNETYVPTIDTGYWQTAATILPGNPADTFIVVTSQNPGTFGYTFTVIDNFGCTYDTTVYVYFLQTPNAPVDTTVCDGQHQFIGTSSYNGGVWTYTGPGTATFSPSNAVDNPFVTIDTNGVYEFTFTDNQCLLDTSFQITFAPDPVIQGDTIVCEDEYQFVGTTSFDGGIWTYTGPGVASFTPNDSVENPLVSVNIQGDYIFTFTDNQCNKINSFQIDFVPEPTVPSEDTICDGQLQFSGTTSYNGGAWTYSGPGTITFTPSDSVENPFITTYDNGLYTFTFTESQCAKDTTVDIYFADSVFVNLNDVEFCIGDDAVLDVTSMVPEASYAWNTGNNTSLQIVTDSGYYFVTVSGLCNSNSDTSEVTTIICDIFAPNVITPNGDGDNDYLVFEGLEHYPESILLIFNRWGNKIYESYDYQNDWGPRDISDGTYFYILTPGGNLDIDIIKRTVTVLK